jgi:hypothetical protein
MAYDTTHTHLRLKQETPPDNQDAPVAVPGYIRWVTTSIARFDPDMAASWPSDLCLQLVINTALATHDGTSIKLPLGEQHMPQQLQFYTDKLALSHASVTSKAADRASDGHWTSAHPSGVSMC